MCINKKENKTKLVYISHMVSPHQVKYCYALQKYFDAYFLFYEKAERTRGSWWDVELGDRCEVLNTIIGADDGIFSAKYYAKNIIAKLDSLNPDILMLGGFSVPSNYMAYRWALRNKKKIIIFTERSRNKAGELRKRNLVWTALRYLYKDVDLVLVSATDIIEQFRDEFGFGEKVVEGRYPADIDDYFEHPARTQKAAYTYLFANRLTEIYNPLGAIEIFVEIIKAQPGSLLLINAKGELGEECRSLVQQLRLEESVEFLDNIKEWSDLSQIYLRSDILLLPANFSNGNYTIIEAMASGMGVVVSNRVLGVGKFISDGDNGFNCEPTSNEFMKRIRQYITNPNLFEKHRIINREIVRPLSTSGTAEHFYSLLESRNMLKA